MSDVGNLLAEILRSPVGTSRRQRDVLEQGERALPVSDSPYPRNSARDWEHRLRGAGTSLPGQIVGGALADLMALPAGLERAISGEYSPADTERMVNDAVPGMFNVMLPGVVGKQRGGPLRNIGGVNSATADLNALRRAKELERGGANAEQIWQHTGWGRTKGGQWFYEIPDDWLELRVHEGQTPRGAGGLPGFYEQSRYASLGDTLTGNLYPYAPITPDVSQPVPRYTLAQDMFEHPELFAAYPELRRVQMDDFAGIGNYGYYNPERNKLALNSGPPERLKGTLLHELGHAVQELESFPQGGNPGMFLPKGYLEWEKDVVKANEALRVKIRKENMNPESVFMALRAQDPAKLLPYEVQMLSELAAKNPEAFKEAQELTSKLLRKEEVRAKTYQNYRALHGEQVAEAIAKRKDLSPFERRARPFFEDYSLPESEHLLQPPAQMEWKP